MLLVKGNVFCLLCSLKKRLGDFPACGVLRVENTAVAVTTFLTKLECLIRGGFFIKINTVRDELLNGLASLGEDRANGLLITETGTCV